jgi:hypothetical protein
MKKALNTMGKRKWHPDTSRRGKRAAQAFQGTCHSRWRKLLEKMVIIISARKLRRSAGPCRLMIRGNKMKKSTCSTTFLVAPHVMLYEERCASRACDKGIERLPKNKKLWVVMRLSKPLE